MTAVECLDNELWKLRLRNGFVKWLARQDKFALIRTSRNFQRKYI